MNGDVELKNVSFEYIAGQPVLKDISVRFKGGKMTALVGPSGSGKSTIINLIMRLYDPQAGAVEVNGMDLRDVSFKLTQHYVLCWPGDLPFFRNHPT